MKSWEFLLLLLTLHANYFFFHFTHRTGYPVTKGVMKLTSLGNKIVFIFWASKACFVFVLEVHIGYFLLVFFNEPAFIQFLEPSQRQTGGTHAKELKRRSSGKCQTITFLQSSLLWNLYHHSLKKKQLSYLRGFRLAGWSIPSTNNAVLAETYTLRPYCHDVHLLILTFDHIQGIILTLFLMNVVHTCYMAWSCKPLLVRVVSCLQRFSRMAHMQYNPDYPNVRGDIE